MAAVASAAILLASAVGFAATTPRGYLDDVSFDILSILPAAPQPGDARYEADRAIFRATRQLVGTPRYDMAARDAIEGTTALLADFSCAVGVRLTPQNAPITAALVARADVDTAYQTNVAKQFYKRKRPFLIDPGPVCQARPSTYDYPSGHTTRGWTSALILSDLLPERTTQILERGRAYGDSRFICGVHNESAVEAGRLSPTATMQAVRQAPAYQADAGAASKELRALISGATTAKPTGCLDEASLVAQPGF